MLGIFRDHWCSDARLKYSSDAAKASSDLEIRPAAHIA